LNSKRWLVAATPPQPVNIPKRAVTVRIEEHLMRSVESMAQHLDKPPARLLSDIISAGIEDFPLLLAQSRPDLFVDIKGEEIGDFPEPEMCLSPLQDASVEEHLAVRAEDGSPAPFGAVFTTFGDTPVRYHWTRTYQALQDMIGKHEASVVSRAHSDDGYPPEMSWIYRVPRYVSPCLAWHRYRREVMADNIAAEGLVLNMLDAPDPEPEPDRDNSKSRKKGSR